MKQVLIFLFTLVVVAACKKTEPEVEPKDPASAVAGTYALSSFSYTAGGESIVDYPKLPVTQKGVTVSASAKVEKTGSETVLLVLLLKATGEQEKELDLGEYTIKESGKTYGFYTDNGTQIAEISAGQLIYEASGTSDGEPVEIVFEAKK
ncbi:hypothetical protein GCM10027347_12050 [Larkinella harenae]